MPSHASGTCTLIQVKLSVAVSPGQPLGVLSSSQLILVLLPEDVQFPYRIRPAQLFVLQALTDVLKLRPIGQDNIPTPESKSWSTIINIHVP